MDKNWEQEARQLDDQARQYRRDIEEADDDRENLRDELEKAKAQIETCRGWLTAIRRVMPRWDDIRTVSGKPSTTQQVDLWLDGPPKPQTEVSLGA